jgi:hypothetical protein
MLKLERKLLCKYRQAGDTKWMPDGMEFEVWYPVVAMKTTKRKDKNNKEVEDILYGIISAKGNLIFVASYNCESQIDVISDA